MEEIMELAGKLGRLIAADPRGERLAKAQAAMRANKEGRETLAEFETQQRKVYELEAQGKPIEPEDKRNLVDLRARVAGNDTIKALSKAQVDIAELMSAVLKRIEQEVISTPADE